MDLRRRIQAHYDRFTPLYVALWGERIHHGYWEVRMAGPPSRLQRIPGLFIAALPRGPQVSSRRRRILN